MFVIRFLVPLRGRGLGGVLCLLILSVNVAVAQNVKVAFTADEMTVSQAIEAIEKQTGYVFSYESGLIDMGGKVAFTAGELSLEDALSQLLKGRSIDYTVVNRHIVLHPSPDGGAGRNRIDPRTDDIYRKTPADSLSAASLRRPGAVSPGATQAGVHPISNLPVRPGLSDFFSDYKPVNEFASIQSQLPVFAAKINLLYAAAALTPNLAAEIGLGPQTSLVLKGSYNPWKRIGTLDDNDKLVHWIVSPGFRYWFCERFNGHFIGGDIFYAKFNISGHKIPFTGFKKGYRYAGDAVGAGVNYGYHLPLGKQWGLEFEVGVGVARMKYDQFECSLCSGVMKNETKTYFGPTSAGVSLVFIIK